MKAKQLLVENRIVVTDRGIADKLAELIDAHNKLVYHTFAAPDAEVKLQALASPVAARDFFGKPPMKVDCIPASQLNTKVTAEEIRFVHNLLIAWGKVCRHIDNKVTEVVTGVFKCETCGLPYIPTGD